jgi:hypothetical protein
MPRHKLHFGPYRTPRFRYGQKVIDERRGEVRIVGTSAGRIPWPVGYGPGGRSLVLFKGLAKAVRREAAIAVMHWWGVGPAAVNKWRRALGVPRWSEGDLLRKAAFGRSPAARKSLTAMWAKAQDPVRIAKIAAARLGKPRPPEVVEGMRQRMLGQKLSAETRAKMSASHRARGTRPPAAGRPFTSEEDEAIRKLTPAEAAAKTGRSLWVVYSRRHNLRKSGEANVPIHGRD